MTRLILLIGLPGSGKSTLAHRWQGDRPDRCVISTDAIRAELFGAADIQGPWLRVWQEVERQFCAAVYQMQQGTLDVALYDATNAARKQRRQAIALARQCGFEQITGWWLNLPLELCLERNRQRDRQVPVPVIEQMHCQLLAAPPSCWDGFDQLMEFSATEPALVVPGSEIAPSESPGTE